MAGEAGRKYEKIIFEELLSSNLTNRKYPPAKSDKSKSDLVFIVKDKKYNLEVKLNLKTDFGQGTLRYDFNKFKWFSYSDNFKMDELLKFYNIEKIANDNWTKVPNKVGKNDIGRKSKTPTRQEILDDKKNFPDVYVNLRGRNPIAEYYNSKDTYYIQIGDLYGFYYLGQDPLNLGVPEFRPPQQKIRLRLKGGGSGGYRFTTAFVIGGGSVSKSKYDIIMNPNFLINAGR